MNCLFFWLSATFNIMSMDILRFTMSWVEEEVEDSGYQQQMDSDNKWASLIKVGSFYHVNIKLVQTAKWCLCNGPKRENKANGGEGAFTSRQAAHVIQVSLVSLTRLHLEEQTRSVSLNSHCFFQVSDIVYCAGTIRPNMLREKCSTYWDREGFILVVKGHVPSEASLSQHAIKVVLTACREEPEMGWIKD